MNTLSEKSTSPLMWVAGIAVILFSAAGIAAIMGWIPTSMGRSAETSEIAVPAQQSGSTTNPAHPAVLASNSATRAHCAACGVIESTREVTTKGEGSGIGAVGGAVVGGLLGNQIGNGRGRTVATAIGAVGGVVAGNEVEKRVKATKSYEITVRLDDGSSRVISEANAPTWRTGDHVRIVNGAIQSNS